MTPLFPLLVSSIFAVSIFLLLEPADKYWKLFSRRYLQSILERFDDISYELPNLDMKLRVWGLAIAASILAGFFMLKPVLGLIVAFIIFIVPKQVLLRKLRKRIFLIKSQLISGIVLISNTTKAGVSLERAFEAAAREIPSPLGSEFQRIAYECSRGRVFESVLLDAKERVKIQEYVVFTAALITNKKRGGDVARTLEEIRKSLVENNRLERKLASDTASGRLTINILAATPICFLLLSQMMNPEGTELMFSSLPGQGILAFATVLTYFGYRWGQKIVDVKF